VIPSNIDIAVPLEVFSSDFLVKMSRVIYSLEILDGKPLARSSTHLLSISIFIGNLNLGAIGYKNRQAKRIF
jgi:hypothetical protein